MEKIPIKIGVIYPPSFANHEISDTAQIEGDSDWLVKTGAAQVQFWNTFLPGMFDQVVVIANQESLNANRDSMAGVLIPRISDLQYSVPFSKDYNVYEVQFFYNFDLMQPLDIHSNEQEALTFQPEQSIASWSLVSYGKTPSEFIQTQEEAVNLAAIVALRDAGANFTQNFQAEPKIARWLETLSLATGQEINTTEADFAKGSEESL
jgi:hypothetical protein